MIIFLGAMSAVGCGWLPGKKAEADSPKPKILAPYNIDRSRDYLTPHPQPRPQHESTDRELTEAEKEFGVRVESLRLSSGGYMLDFRYQVQDPEKARPLLERKAKAHLFHPKSGAWMAVPTPPKVGSLRQKTTEPEPGRIYFMIFANPGQFLRPGDEVNVVIGDFTAEGVVIE